MLTNSSAEGYCGATELGGDCTTDSTGAWALSRAQGRANTAPRGGGMKLPTSELLGGGPDPPSGWR